MRAELTRTNAALASRLLKLNGATGTNKATAITEGTPTEVLAPESDATRQKDMDIQLAMNKFGIPAPVGAEPAGNNGEFSMGTQDPMGQDEPAHNQPGQPDQQFGMTRPEDRKGDNYNAGPGSQTSSEQGGLSDGNKPRFEGTVIEGFSDEDLIEMYIEVCGSIDEALWSLCITGIPLREAEAVLLGGDPITEGVMGKLAGKIQQVSAKLGISKPAVDKVALKKKLHAFHAASSPTTKPKFMKKDTDKPFSAFEKKPHKIK